MTILAKFLRLLEWLEASQSLFAFLLHPLGISGIVGVYAYLLIDWLGCAPAAAATLSSTVALTFYCLLERPKF
ncbi:MAG: hypothetical protein AAF921_18875 [Cyanobacteria bacterium P01_D01_bin.44]